jgi:hypothetical protein
MKRQSGECRKDSGEGKVVMCVRVWIGVWVTSGHCRVQDCHTGEASCVADLQQIAACNATGIVSVLRRDQEA